ncbi:MAG TPA: response regulator [Opitutaceae bacterium]|nr:response regulator [Opitutaceae bacterium]
MVSLASSTNFPVAAAAAPATPSPTPVSGMRRVLIVDDSRIARAAVRRELSDAHFDIQEAVDGEAALQIIRDGFRPDLVTLDLEMPRLGGFPTCERLRSPEFTSLFTHCAGGRMPVIFITGSDNLNDRRRGFELGAMDFVSKPFDPGTLARTAGRLLFPTNRLTGVTALLVEDSATVRLAVATSLREEGATVLEAADGDRGLELVAQTMGQLDIVITDLDMPGMDGSSLCRRIRREFGLVDLPVVILTAIDDQTLRLDAFRAGASDCLSKPLIKEEIVARLITHIERYRLDRRLNACVRELRENMRFKDEMLSTLSHDMRTPLNGVMGFADLLLNSIANNAESRENLTLIKDSGQMLLHLIDEILNLSRASARNADLELRPVAFAAIVRQSVRALHPLADRKKQSLIWRSALDAGGDLVNGHSESLLRVVNNLLGNAIKFTSSGGQIRVNLEAGEAGKILLRITDNGIGIPAEKLPSLFDRFTPVSQPGTAGEASTGLGMSIVKQLVEQHGGKIEVTSAPGLGTEFRVILPQLPPTTRVDSTPPQNLSARNDRPARDLGALRVLVVDDNPVNRRVAELMLQRAGCPVSLATCGQEAVDAMAAAKEGFQVVLMDVEMPGMGGLEATRLLRERHGAAPRIVAMTSHSGEEQIAACLAAGMNAVLTKPLSQARLISELSA